MTQRQPTNVTKFDQSQVSNLQRMLEDLALNGARIRYEKVIPTTSTIQENEIIIYDDGAGTTRGYCVTREGTLFEFGGNSTFQTGMICMWSGTIASIPTGFVLCDGSNSTPDLTNRFIVGADADDSGTAKSTVTGSALQTSDGVMPSHTHDTPAGQAGGGALNGSQAWSSSVEAFGTDGTSDTAGTGTKVIAVFYALAYIMKT